MADYIDRKKIFPNGVFFANADDPLASLDELIKRIWSIPAADVVEVVRCKDCVYSKNYTCTRGEMYDDTRYRPDYFCADGERRDNNEADST